MKFSQFKPGERFEWEGVLYVKVGPVSARDVATGRLRMIPRYAHLQPVEAPAADAQPDSPPVSDLRAAFDAFFGECLAALDEPQAAARTRLLSARQRFLTILGLPQD